MIALLMLTHEPADRVKRMVEFWKVHTGPAEVVVAYGGRPEEFEKIAGRKVFIEDPRLRTRDHQRERQSYTEVLKGGLQALEGANWEWLYLAEYDMLPLRRDVWDLLKARAEEENADLLGHRMWRLDDTLHPHYASHLATPAWLQWIDSISCRSNPNTVVSCMGCGQFWRREALEEVMKCGEPVRAYLELQLPTVAHHLGFRLRGLEDQDRFISNHVIEGASAELLRDTGGWVMHPLKDLWRSANLEPGLEPAEPPRVSEDLEPSRDGVAEETNAMPISWMGDLGGLLERIGVVASGSRPLDILRGGKRLAIGLPEDPEAARVVLNLYHPNRILGNLFRLLARGLVRLGLSGKVLKSEGGGDGGPLVAWLRKAADEGRVGFVGGNPAHGPRCLLGGVCETEEGNWIPFVAKLGFDESRAAIEREWRNLSALSGRYEGVLRPLSFDAGKDWALLRLPHLGYLGPKDMKDPIVIQLLCGWWGKDRKLLGEIAWADDLLKRAESLGVSAQWCQRMRGHRIRVALVHGDFAIWNIRSLAHGPCAIDWEWAEENGAAGVDLAHGLRQEAVMVRRLDPARAVKWLLARSKQTPWRNHLRGCGWAELSEDWLALGLLHSHFNAKSDSREMLAELGLHLDVEA